MLDVNAVTLVVEYVYQAPTSTDADDLRIERDTTDRVFLQDTLHIVAQPFVFELRLDLLGRR